MTVYSAFGVCTFFITYLWMDMGECGCSKHVMGGCTIIHFRVGVLFYNTFMGGCKCL